MSQAYYIPNIYDVYHVKGSAVYFLITAVEHNNKKFTIAYLGKHQGIRTPEYKFSILDKNEYTLL